MPELASFEELSLTDTKSTDAGLAELAELRHLTGLHLSGTVIDGGGLASFRVLPTLVELDASETPFNDGGTRCGESAKEGGQFSAESRPPR